MVANTGTRKLDCTTEPVQTAKETDKHYAGRLKEWNRLCDMLREKRQREYESAVAYRKTLTKDLDDELEALGWGVPFTRPDPRYSPFELEKTGQETHKAIKAFLDGPVTRREFDQEVERIWCFLEPELCNDSKVQPDSAFSLETVAGPWESVQDPVERVTFTNVFAEQVAQALTAMRRERKPRNVPEQAIDYADRIRDLREKLSEMREETERVQEVARLIKHGRPFPAYIDPKTRARGRQYFDLSKELNEMLAAVGMGRA